MPKEWPKTTLETHNFFRPFY